jgi:hypothetical protein
MALAVGAQTVAGAVEVDDHRLEAGEIAHQIGPGRGQALGVEPALEVDLKAEREEAAGSVAEDAVVALVEDRADVEGGLSVRKARSTRHSGL